MQQQLGFIFPGQGSQKVGMLADLAEAYGQIEETFSEASEVLGYDLWALCQNDPDEQLGLTHITQPAILTASIAIWRLWCSQGGARPALLAGHSLGEYSALVCSESLTFTDAVALVRKRGELMQTAVPVGTGAMAAIVGLSDSEVVSICENHSGAKVVEPVNFNSPGQIVIAGHKEAVENAMQACKEKGAKRAIPLPVSAPFHSSLMRPAAAQFVEVLEAVAFSSPKIPVLQNYKLSLSKDNSCNIQDNLVNQIFSLVPWTSTIRFFNEKGVNTVVECGPGRVLCGLNKRISAGMEALPTESRAAFEAALEAWQA
ncbi:MAG: [acyl-carrier-protein] S-malonyltransferase [Gammaproteobacteria bacterium]|nr:[acyl-carrier-protein] S-malonyltransferase [Gammaproteobacteria bacterium]MAY02508.1 [acyl-carrier-protein] S-malonyltransferase [Gammaproteobacteria bacterium]|tara:strand:- start:109 stop:1053 length:945 start_codon:yes stop_codon:yes gene_type:complete